MALLPLSALISLQALFLFGIIANLIVIILFVRQKKYTFDQKVFVVSVNLADLVALTASFIVVIITQFMTLSMSGVNLFVCNALAYIVTCTLQSSATNFCIVAFHRFLSVAKPATCKTIFTPKKCLLITLLGWIFGFLPTSLALLTGWCTMRYFSGKHLCTFYYTRHISYTIFVLTTFTAIPIVYVTVNYCSLFLIVRKQRRKIQIAEPSKITSSSNEEQPSLKKLNREHKLMIQLIIITVLFLFCWTPGSTAARFIGYEDGDKSPIGTISTAAILLNSVVNPFLYILPNSLLRAQFKEMLRNCFSKHNP